ncbi:MAG: serine--tRNA ligase [Candidatus Saccharimonadia bacterium]
MVDLKHLRQNPKDYIDSAHLRGVTVDIHKLLELDTRRAEMIGQIDALRSKLKSKAKPAEKERTELQAAKVKLEALEADFIPVDADITELLWRIPNLIADGTPHGGEEANKELRTWKPAENSKVKAPKDHLSLAIEKDLLDFERGAKVAGSKFLFTKGATIRLEMAVMRLAIDVAEAAGFTIMGVPHMVNDRIAAGTGFLPRGEEAQIYRVEGQDLNLIATAELPLTGYHADEILDPEKLPILYAGISPCYRLEAGAYGKHSKGFYRVHQFDKLEMYVYAKASESSDWHEKLLAIEEDIVKMLEIPYRVVRIAAGDLGAPAYKKYDIEYYSPVDKTYRELTSCSNCTDFQARRLAIRTRGANGQTEFVHTLNGTAIAFSRVFIALLENHQTEDGSIAIPAALQSYYGGKTL